MKLVKETPAERRKFLDVGLSQQQKTYFIALSRYNKVLKQKNNLLKEALKQKNNLLKEAYKQTDPDAMLSVWDAQLAEYGAEIVVRRKRYVEELNQLASAAHEKMSGGREKLTLSYETPLSADGSLRMGWTRSARSFTTSWSRREKKINSSGIAP